MNTIKCVVDGCTNKVVPDYIYCHWHLYNEDRPARVNDHNEDEIIVPDDDDVDEELLTTAFKLSAADLVRKAKKQGLIQHTSGYVAVPAA